MTPAAWIATGARSKQMFCGADRPDITVIHGNDLVQSIEPLYSRETVDELREALRWNAAALQALAKIHKAHVDDRFVMDNDDHKSMGEILDMADKALEVTS